MKAWWRQNRASLGGGGRQSRLPRMVKQASSERQWLLGVCYESSPDFISTNTFTRSGLSQTIGITRTWGTLDIISGSMEDVSENSGTSLDVTGGARYFDIEVMANFYITAQSDEASGGQTVIQRPLVTLSPYLYSGVTPWNDNSETISYGGGLGPVRPFPLDDVYWSHQQAAIWRGHLFTAPNGTTSIQYGVNGRIDWNVGSDGNDNNTGGEVTVAVESFSIHMVEMTASEHDALT